MRIMKYINKVYTLTRRELKETDAVYTNLCFCAKQTFGLQDNQQVCRCVLERDGLGSCRCAPTFQSRDD